eukprot:SAG31_NODE_23203_length_509_cov_0.739024_1_plen_106_part_00
MDKNSILRLKRKIVRYQQRSFFPSPLAGFPIFARFIFAEFENLLVELEGLLRHSGGPYIYGRELSAADCALGPRLQCALLGVRHFNEFNLPVPPYNGIHRYKVFK